MSSIMNVSYRVRSYWCSFGGHDIQIAGVTCNCVSAPGMATGMIGNLTVLNAAGSEVVAIVPARVGFSGAARLGGHAVTLALVKR